MRDFIYAFRTLRHSPSFVVIAVVTLALGIGANTAIFSLFFQVLLRSLPVSDPQELVVLHSERSLNGRSTSDNHETVFSYPFYTRMAASSGKVFDGVLARSGTAVDILRNGGSDRAQAEVVSGNFFSVLGTTPYAGRLLSAQDDTVRDGNPVVVLGYGYWRAHFGSTDVLNRKILVNGNPMVVIGIAPEQFHGVLSGQTPDIYLPLSMKTEASPGWTDTGQPTLQWLTIIGRLKDGVSRSQAQAALAPVFTSILREELPALQVSSTRAQQRILAKKLELRPAEGGLNEFESTWSKPLTVLLVMVSTLLLIACANLASLLLVRAAARSREFAIRLAIGASRFQIARQLFAESLTIAIMSGVLGAALSFALTKGLLRILPEDMTGGWIRADLNGSILLFSLVISALSGLIFGILPAFHASRGDVTPALKDDTHGSAGVGQIRWRKILVSSQIALSLLLLVAAGLFTRSLTNLLHTNPGFHFDNLLTFSIDPRLNGYTVTRAVNVYRDIESQLAALPGVASVSFAGTGPFAHSHSFSNVTVEGYTAREEENTDSEENGVGAGYFRTMGVPLLAGREFTAADNETAGKVAVINRAFARRFFGDRNPLGRHMERGAGGPLAIQVVGVVGDVQTDDLRQKPGPAFYVPFSQWHEATDAAPSAMFFLRTHSEDATLTAAVRRIVNGVDPAVPVYDMRTERIRVEESMYTDRLMALLAAAFGLLALLLAVVGLYGVLAYSVARRTREIGIRVALGADQATILAMVFREMAVVTAIGIGIGFLAALLLARTIQSQLFGIRAADPQVFLAAILALVCVATVAALIPAFRASRVNPMNALRYE